MAPDQIDTSPVAPDAPREEQLRALIENISAYIEYYHGGSVSMIALDDRRNVLQVAFGGACDGCPLSLMTLKGWVEGTVRQFFPEITVEEAAAD